MPGNVTNTDTINALCKYFGCQPGELLRYVEEEDSPAGSELDDLPETVASRSASQIIEINAAFAKSPAHGVRTQANHTCLPR